MIYYSTQTATLLQIFTQLITRGNELVVGSFELDGEEALERVEKWAERYHLLETPQQTYRRRLSGEAVFSLIVEFGFYALDEAEAEVAGKKYEQKVTLTLFCKGSEKFFFDEERQRQLDPVKEISAVNALIRKQIPNAEIFRHVTDLRRVKGHYELVRITKKAKSIKELKENNWKKTNHATDWTWRLTASALKTQTEQGQRLINRFQNLLGKNGVTLAEKKAYFEKHFRALEGYLGYRGVRQQVGLLYHEEAKLFKNRYQCNWLDHGGRKLNLSYVKTHKNVIKNNAEYVDAHSKYISIFNDWLLRQAK